MADTDTTPAGDEYVADGPINLGGVRAYNDGDRVSADAVKRNKLEKQVKKVNSK